MAWVTEYGACPTEEEMAVEMRAAATDPRITVRVPAPLLASLRTRHAETYPQHRMSWNTWLVSQLDKLVEK